MPSARFGQYLAGAVLALGLATATTSLAAETPAFKQGTDYHLVVPVQPTDAGPGQVQVLEFFWYGCPHCRAFEPYLESWLANKPGGVLFKRVPAVVNPAWKPQARAFYTARALGILEEVHKAIFDSIQSGQSLRDEKDFQHFFARYGIDKDQFEDAWHSSAVDSSLKEAAILGERYRVTGVPTMVVGGMYSTGAAEAHGFPRLIDIVNFLIDKRLANQE